MTSQTSEAPSSTTLEVAPGDKAVSSSYDIYDSGAEEDCKPLESGPASPDLASQKMDFIAHWKKGIEEDGDQSATGSRQPASQLDDVKPNTITGTQDERIGEVLEKIEALLPRIKESTAQLSDDKEMDAADRRRLGRGVLLNLDDVLTELSICRKLITLDPKLSPTYSVRAGLFSPDPTSSEHNPVTFFASLPRKRSSFTLGNDAENEVVSMEKYFSQMKESSPSCLSPDQTQIATERKETSPGLHGKEDLPGIRQSSAALTDSTKRMWDLIYLDVVEPVITAESLTDELAVLGIDFPVRRHGDYSYPPSNEPDSSNGSD